MVVRKSLDTQLTFEHCPYLSYSMSAKSGFKVQSWVAGRKTFTTTILRNPVCTSANNCTGCIYNVQGSCAALKVSSTDSTVMAVGRDIILYCRKLLEKAVTLHVNRRIIE